MTNTGVLTAVVVPATDGQTRLTQAPDANPTDEASVAALEAVANSGFAARVPGLPGGIPLSQVYVVPPGWSVCALSGRLGFRPSTLYQRDKSSSAEYFATKKLAEQLASFVTPTLLKNSRTLVSCAQGGAHVVRGYPALEGVDLYARMVGDGSACRSAYKLLLSNDERATRTVQTKTLDFLERTPKLLQTTQLMRALTPL